MWERRNATMLHELLEIETEGWRALSSDRHVAEDFFGRLLSDDAAMVFPGMVLEGKDAILRSLGAQPWKTFEIHEARVVPAGGTAAVLAYRVAATREGLKEYRALISSVYVRENGSWVLAFHQHSPG
jgi:hypothetical protein